MPTVKLYQFEMSPFCDKVRRALYYKKLPYEVIEVLPSQMGKYKNISPTSKFPAIEIDGRVIVDSTNIILELERASPKPPLLPMQPREKALVHILEDWADESLYFCDIAIRTKPNNMALLLEDLTKHESATIGFVMKRMLPGMTRKWGTVQGLGRKSSDNLKELIQEHFSALETLLEGGDWLVGDHLTVADVSVAAMIHVLIRAEEPAELLPTFDRLSNWQNRVNEATLPPA